MVTLTGTFTRLDGTPATGTVRVTPSRSPIMDPDGKIVISGPQVFPLDKDGKLTTEIPASNDPDLGPAFTYAIDVNLSHASWKISKVWIPHGSTTVDLSEIGDYTPVPGVATRVVTIPADGTDGQVLVWDGAGFSWDFPPEGPQGPPGEVTTAALTTALAGKVTGTGLALRHDTTVGTRVLLDHPGGTTMLYGDTGWRNISGLLTNGWTGNAWIRRDNNLVTLRVHGLSPANATTTTFLAPIQGFGWSTSSTRGPRPVFHEAQSPVTLRRFAAAANGITDQHAVPANVSLFGDTTWHSNDTWPTTLPGLPL